MFKGPWDNESVQPHWRPGRRNRQHLSLLLVSLLVLLETVSYYFGTRSPVRELYQKAGHLIDSLRNGDLRYVREEKYR